MTSGRKGNAGLGPWAHPPWAWRGVSGHLLLRRLWSGEAQGLASPSASWARASAQGGSAPGMGVLWPQALGGLPPAHHDAKRTTRYRVSGCMDAVCSRLCSWAAGTIEEPGESSAENLGQGRVGLSARRRGGPASLEEVGYGLGWGLGCDLSPGPEGCCGHVCVSLGIVTMFLHDWVSRFVCPNVTVSTSMWPQARVEMFPCPRVHVSTFVPGHIHQCPHLPVAASAHVHHGHIYTAPYFSLLLFIRVFVYVSELGQGVPEACLWVRLCCCVSLWGVCVCVPVCLRVAVFLCVAPWTLSS